MKRLDAIKIILDSLKDDDAAIFTTGMISREAFYLKDRKANFYMIGSMGLASSVGLGVALNSSRRVFVFDGDGSVLMDMGTMATIGAHKPPKLIHIVLDNESYQSAGGQPNISNITQLDKIAKNAGYLSSGKIYTAEKLKIALRDIDNRKCPFFILIKTLEKVRESPKRVDLAPFQINERFKQFLNKEQNCKQ